MAHRAVLGGPALPFVIFRAWKIPVGHVNEEIRLYGPSGRTPQEEVAFGLEQIGR